MSLPKLTPAKFRALFIVALLAVALNALNLRTGATTGAAPTPWQAKVAPEVLETIYAEDSAEFIVFMAEQADLSAAWAVEGKAEKGRLVHMILSETAEHSQAALLEQLQGTGAVFRSYWIANMVWVRGNESALRTAAQTPGVAHVYANPYRQLQLPEQPLNRWAPETPQGIEPNINLIRAPEVWALGVNGQGAVIGGQDTGYDWDHPALKSQYRGWNGATADHDYNWHDAIHAGAGDCDPDSVEPCDDNGHGTHTMGTMVGDDGATNQIGVAPGAQWIGCRNMYRGVGSPVTYSECFQWFVAPTDGNGENPDPAMAPHVVNNSWACPQSEGCEEVDILQTVVENVRAAGIVVVASAGNSGVAGCGTVQYQPAIYEATFSVGATVVPEDENDEETIASFSSRGPVIVDGSNRLKPDVVAPGFQIRSSIPGGNYGNSSGTSMAAPHVSGLVALLIATNPTLSGDVTAIETAITASALGLTTTETCGGVAGTEIPNNTFGYGRIDALEAYLLVQTQNPLPYRYFFPIYLIP